MENNKNEIQVQLSELIHRDVVSIISDYSTKSILDLSLVITLVQDINLLKTYDVEYIHNCELNDLMELMREELKNINSARVIALLSCFDYILDTTIEFKQHIYVNLTLKASAYIFKESFSIFNVLVPSVKELFKDFIYYIFNDKFLLIDENIQIESIYKIWYSSMILFHDKEASKFAYDNLKPLFEKALLFEKTEVAFWLYYTPLHYFHSGIGSNIDELNEKFKNEIEKPLENYILKKIVPKYDIELNKKTITKNGKIKVAFVMQRIIRHSTMNVFYSLIKNLMTLTNDKYEFIIYDMSFAEAGGSQRNFVEEFIDLGVKYRNLHYEIFGNNEPTYSLLRKCIKTRETLIKDEIDILIGLHTRVEYIFLYATRTAPKQIYWYHNSNAHYDIKGIDKRVTHGGIPFNSKYEFKRFDVVIDYKQKENIEIHKEVEKIRSRFSKDTFILGSIGRLVKIDNDGYLETVFKIMKKNPHTIYLACGDGDKSNIEKKVKDNNLQNRFFFEGHIEPLMYGKVIELYLNTFPISSGESLNEYVANGGVSVILLDKEHLAIKEIFEKGLNTSYERQFAFDQEDYILLANNLIKNTHIRKEISERNIKKFSLKEDSIKKSCEAFIKSIS